MQADYILLEQSCNQTENTLLLPLDWKSSFFHNLKPVFGHP